MRTPLNLMSSNSSKWLKNNWSEGGVCLIVVLQCLVGRCEVLTWHLQYIWGRESSLVNDPKGPHLCKQVTCCDPCCLFKPVRLRNLWTSVQSLLEFCFSSFFSGIPLLTTSSRCSIYLVSKPKLNLHLKCRKQSRVSRRPHLPSHVLFL